MVSNSNITIYHKVLDEETKIEKWIRYNYNNVWCFKSRNANVDKGYNNADRIEVRISYELSPNIQDFARGDIIIVDDLQLDITRQQDLDGFEIYNIISIKNNTFGSRPHIHISGE